MATATSLKKATPHAKAVSRIASQPAFLRGVPYFFHRIALSCLDLRGAFVDMSGSFRREEMVEVLCVNRQVVGYDASACVHTRAPEAAQGYDIIQLRSKILYPQTERATCPISIP